VTKLNKNDFTIQMRRGLRANVEKPELFYNHAAIPQGEPLYTTDTKQLFIVDSAGVSAVQSLDMAVIDEDYQVVVDENYEMVHTF
jgi:hypothetical protein